MAPANAVAIFLVVYLRCDDMCNGIGSHLECQTDMKAAKHDHLYQGNIGLAISCQLSESTCRITFYQQCFITYVLILIQICYS